MLLYPPGADAFCAPGDIAGEVELGLEAGGQERARGDGVRQHLASPLYQFKVDSNLDTPQAILRTGVILRACGAFARSFLHRGGREIAGKQKTPPVFPPAGFLARTVV